MRDTDAGDGGTEADGYDRQGGGVLPWEDDPVVRRSDLSNLAQDIREEVVYPHVSPIKGRCTRLETIVRRLTARLDVVEAQMAEQAEQLARLTAQVARPKRRRRSAPADGAGDLFGDAPK